MASMLRKEEKKSWEKVFDDIKVRNAINILDAVIVSLNSYLIRNKNKVRYNESRRSDDIETITNFIYDCFNKRMNDVIDDVLSDENLTASAPIVFPSPLDFNQYMTTNT